MTKTIQTIALGALTTLATVAGGAAQAGYVYQGYHLMDGSDFVGHEAVATQMIGGLSELGIPVIDGGKEKLEVCEERNEEGFGTLGFYVPSMNVMAICTQSTGYGDMAMETLTHETVHVIQDARDGIENDTLVEGDAPYLMNLATGLGPQTYGFITEAYDEADWAVEVEAFYFETQPEAVAEELTRWAF